MPTVPRYTTQEVCQLLGVTRSWLRTRERSGRIPAPRRTIGGHRAYTSEDLEILRGLADQEMRGGPVRHDAAAAAPVTRVTTRIAIVNQKGGVGKTTITHNLGFALGDLGYRVLMVDLDPQANLSLGCGRPLDPDGESGLGAALYAAAAVPPVATAEDDSPAGPYAASVALARAAIVPTRNPRVDLLPTSMEMMVRAESELDKPGLAVLAPSLLHRLMEELDSDYQLVLFDCPPNLGLLTVNGMVASTQCLIPVDCHFAVSGLKQLRGWVDLISRHYGKLRLLGIVLNRFDARTRNSQGVEGELAAYAASICETRLSSASKVGEATQYGEALIDYEPKHAVSLQFRALAREVVGRLDNAPPVKGGAP